MNISTLGAGKTATFIFLLSTIIFGGIRWQTGTDWDPYYEYFMSSETWSEFNTSSTFEILYVFLNFIIKELTNSYTVFLFILSFLVITISYRSILKIASFPIIAYYLLFCTTTGGMFPVRQSIATAIGLSSVYYIHKRKKIIFIIITLIGCGFHRVMWLWFIAYPIYQLKGLDIKKVILLFCGAIMIGTMGSAVITQLVYSVVVEGNMTALIATKIAGYTMRTTADYYNFSTMLAIMIKKALFIPLILMFYRQIIKTNVYLSGLINIYLAGNIIYFIFAFNPFFFNLLRLTDTFIIVEPLIIVSAITILKKYNLNNIALLMIFVLGIVKLYTNINTFYSEYIPYRSIFGGGI